MRRIFSLSGGLGQSLNPSVELVWTAIEPDGLYAFLFRTFGDDTSDYRRGGFATSLDAFKFRAYRLFTSTGRA